MGSKTVRARRLKSLFLGAFLSTVVVGVPQIVFYPIFLELGESSIGQSVAPLFYGFMAMANNQPGDELPEVFVNSAFVEDGTIIYEVELLPPTTITLEVEEPVPPVGVQPPLEPSEKIDPPLFELMQDPDLANEFVTIIVRFVDDLVIPEFPNPVFGEPRDSDANQAALEEAQGLISGIQEQRNAFYDSDPIAGALGEVDAVEESRFWLSKTIVVTMRLGNVLTLAQNLSDDLLFIELDLLVEPPPENQQGGPPVPGRGAQSSGHGYGTIEDGRLQIGTDPYVRLGMRGVWVALLDTGLRSTHNLFVGVDGERYDCVTYNGCYKEGERSGLNLADCQDHGTASAAILAANGHLERFRGILAAPLNTISTPVPTVLDTYKIYSAPSATVSGCSSSGVARTSSVEHAIEEVIGQLDRVLVIEVQNGTSYWSGLSPIADRAYEQGLSTSHS